MKRDELAKKAKLLEGMSYLDWRKFSESVNYYFDLKKREQEQQLKPPGEEELQKAIRSRFG